MSVVDRRRFLAAGALGAAGLAAAPAAEPPAAKDEDKKPKFRLGLVTYNLAANWDLPSLLKACQSDRRISGRAAHHPQARRRAVAGQGPAQGGQETLRRRRRGHLGLRHRLRVPEPDPAVVRKNIETCKQFVQLVADIGGKGVKVRPNGLPDKDAIPKTLDQIGKALIPAATRPRTPASKSGSRSTARARPTRPT